MARAAGLLVYRVANQQFEYLLLKASYPPYHWTPPKGSFSSNLRSILPFTCSGHVDPGENEWQAAQREAREEANIQPADLDVHKDFEHKMEYDTPNEGRKTVTYWLAELKTKDITLSHEHTHWEWQPLEPAVKLSKFPEMEKMLREAEEYLQKKKSA
ncbi:Bis(5'-nucleosyl)-tetraphosphatase [asymmetrical] [Aphelenchoides fujianensis]|nr:Bis(5'-nucleosyl)-tetraphosphatase [asymmetrical] [Aphelenchoides fujianensis]